MVKCPSCGGEAPLLNSLWLSKAAGDMWGVKVVPQTDKTVTFEVFSPFCIASTQRLSST